MNRTIGYLAFGVCSLILASFAVLQAVKIGELVQEVKTQENNVVQRDRALEAELSITEELNNQIAELNSVIAELNGQIDVQKGEINDLKSKLRRRDNKFSELEKKIAWLEKDKKKNGARIQELEEEKTRLLKDMETLNLKLQQKEVQAQQAEEERMRKTIEQTKLERINRITNHTWVDYHEISLTKKVNKGKISKVKEGSDDWKYTMMNFSMKNTDAQLLLDANFLLKILNSETGEILQYIEANPEYPQSETSMAGVTFKFENNPVLLTHINNQEKTGSQYEIRLYYIEDGQEHLMTNCSRTIVQNGKPFSL